MSIYGETLDKNYKANLSRSPALLARLFACSIALSTSSSVPGISVLRYSSFSSRGVIAASRVVALPSRL